MRENQEQKGDALANNSDEFTSKNNKRDMELNWQQSQSRTQQCFNAQEKQKLLKQIKLEKYRQLLKQVNYFDSDEPIEKRKYKYTHNVYPYLFFYKLLARKPDGSEEQQKSTSGRLRLWFPDTIVLNDHDLPPMWFYTSQEGYVYRTDLFNYKNVVAKLNKGQSPDELCVAFKKPGFKNMELCGNEVQLITSKHMQLAIQSMFSNKGEITVIQSFVKSSGPQAFIVRTCWRKDQNPYSWIITQKRCFSNKDPVPDIYKFTTTPNIYDTCTIIQTNKGRFVSETTPYIQNLLKYLKLQLNISFSEFIADFIRDESGTWWMINIKGFIIDTNVKLPINIQSVTHFGDTEYEFSVEKQKTKQFPYDHLKPCQYCEIKYPSYKLQHFLTLRQIYQIDKHLIHRNKRFSWLQRVGQTHVDTCKLYTKYPVCDSCFKFQQEIDKLIQIEWQFARKLGIPTKSEQKYYSVSQIDLQQNHSNGKRASRLQQTHDHQQQCQIPENWDLDMDQDNELLVLKDCPQFDPATDHQMDRYRFLVILHTLKEFSSADASGHKYHIEYSLFNEKIKYPIDIQGIVPMHNQSGDCLKHLNFTRVFYFFASSRKLVCSFLDQNPIFYIYLFRDELMMGKIEIEMKEYKSEQVVKQDYYKYFSGPAIPFMKWGLTITTGLVQGGLQDTSQLKLSEYYDLYIPEQSFYTCEPLPQDWLAVISQKPDIIVQQQNNSQVLNEVSPAMSRYFEQSPDQCLKQAQNPEDSSLAEIWQGSAGTRKPDKFNKSDILYKTPNDKGYLVESSAQTDSSKKRRSRLNQASNAPNSVLLSEYSPFLREKGRSPPFHKEETYLNAYQSNEENSEARRQIFSAKRPYRSHSAQKADMAGRQQNKNVKFATACNLQEMLKIELQNDLSDYSKHQNSYSQNKFAKKKVYY